MAGLTLFILGAGASNEVGLPTGAMLKEIVSRKLLVSATESSSTDVDIPLLRAVMSTKHHRAFRTLARQIATSLPKARSIDHYMQVHAADEAVQLLGKLAIIQAILEGEAQSSLKGEATIGFPAATETWFGKLFTGLAERVGEAKNVGKFFQNVAFINFNYDRCLEKFFSHSIEDFYKIHSSEADDIVASVQHFHPYGTIAPWHGASRRHEFGEPVENSKHMIELTERIRTYYESPANTDELVKMRLLVASADKIIFLGFGFHQMNLDLIKPEGMPKAQWVYGSAMGFSDDDRAAVEQRIRVLLQQAPAASDDGTSRRIRLLPATCSGLFEHYSLSLVTA